MKNIIITQEKALEIATQYMKRENLAKRYIMDDAYISYDDEEYFVEFNDIRGDIEPGVCIIGVNKKTGAASFIPVE